MRGITNQLRGNERTFVNNSLSEVKNFMKFVEMKKNDYLCPPLTKNRELNDEESIVNHDGGSDGSVNACHSPTTHHDGVARPAGQ